VNECENRHWIRIISVFNYIFGVISLWIVMIVLIIIVPFHKMIMELQPTGVFELLVFLGMFLFFGFIAFNFTVCYYYRLAGICRENINATGFKDMVMDFVMVNKSRYVVHEDISELHIGTLLLEQSTHQLIMTVEDSYSIFIKSTASSNPDPFKGSIEIIPYNESTKFAVDRLLDFFDENINLPKYNATIIDTK
jgi:hypothetical protein